MIRLLFDQNISFRILSRLPDNFANCQQVRTVGLLDRSDIDIWNYAKDNDYVIVTFDADFYDISLIKGIPPKIIWLRTGNLTTNEIAELMILNYYTIQDFIADNNCLCMEIE